MAKKTAIEPEEPQTENVVVEPIVQEEPGRATFVYVGPKYNQGIALHGNRTLLKPLDWSQEQIAAFLEAHPEKAHWWATESQ